MYFIEDYRISSINYLVNEAHNITKKPRFRCKFSEMADKKVKICSLRKSKLSNLLQIKLT